MKWILITAIGLVSLTILAGIIYIRVNSLPPEENITTSEPLKPAPEEGTIRISEDKFSGPTVRYYQNKFYPASVEVKSDFGCALAIFNEGSTPLQIGLSPHQEVDPGSLYPEIPPQGSIIIDPRFRIKNIAFHSHHQPPAEFSVIPGAGCELE